MGSDESGAGPLGRVARENMPRGTGEKENGRRRIGIYVREVGTLLTFNGALHPATDLERPPRRIGGLKLIPPLLLAFRTMWKNDAESKGTTIVGMEFRIHEFKVATTKWHSSMLTYLP